MNYLIARTYEFKNGWNGARCRKTVYFTQSTPEVENWEYCSDDNFRPSDFGNGVTSVTEVVEKEVDYEIPLSPPKRLKIVFEPEEE